MSQNSSIEWTEHTWNPVSGCTKISSGCKNCYAETIANRFWKDRKFTDVQTHSHKLIEPVKRKKPTTYFVNSMSDLFHEDVPFEFIDQVFAVMASTSQHTYQVLTKRPERMLEYFQRLLNGTSDPDPNIWYEARKPIWSATKEHTREYIGVMMSAYVKFPLKNVWLGVSVEDQEQADIRIPVLLQVPAQVRFLSCEPLLGPIVFDNGWSVRGHPWVENGEPKGISEGIDWVIIGGESGQNARPCDIDWMETIVKQCKDAKVACFVKQLGSNVEACDIIDAADYFPNSVRLSEAKKPNARVHLADSKGGDITEWPTDLQVREFPTS